MFSKIFKLLRLLLVILLFTGGSFILSCQPEATTPPGGTLRAAVIDQLYLMDNSRTFAAEATAILEGGGYTVDVYRGEEITVAFYRELPARDYDLLLFSTHAGILYYQGEGAVPRQSTYLFSGETYSSSRYIGEQLSGRVQNGWMGDDLPLVFCLSADYIREDLKDDFDGAAIIMMGCSSFADDDLAEAFLERGAVLYTGWSATLSLEHADRATISLLENLLTENLDVSDAIDATMASNGRDPVYGARLKFAPETAAGLTVSGLLQSHD